MPVGRKNEGSVNDGIQSSGKNGEWDLDEPAAQDWSALSAEATPSEVLAKQIYFTPV